MSLSSMRARIRRTEQALAGRDPNLDATLRRLQTSPAEVMRAAGMEPDPWQQRVLTSDARQMMLCCSRQVGKSTVVAALGMHTAMVKRNSLVLLLSPSQRQSGELFRKVAEFYQSLGSPMKVRKQSALGLELPNGSRVVALPGTEKTVRSFSKPDLVVIDEAALSHDGLYRAVRPMLATNQGRLVGLSTPYGKRGWFYEAWDKSPRWEKHSITAHQCSRITDEFLEEERESMGERWFRQEYECSFEDTIDAFFTQAEIEAAFTGTAEPLFLGGR